MALQLFCASHHISRQVTSLTPGFLCHLFSCQKCFQIISSPDGSIFRKTIDEQEGLFSLMTKILQTFLCHGSISLSTFPDDQFSQLVPSLHEKPLLNNVCFISLYDKSCRWTKP